MSNKLATVPAEGIARLIASGISPSAISKAIEDEYGLQLDAAALKRFSRDNQLAIRREINRLSESVENLPMAAPAYKLLLLNDVLQQLHDLFEAAVEEGSTKGASDLTGAIVRVLRLAGEFQKQLPTQKVNVYIDKIQQLNLGDRKRATELLAELHGLIRGAAPIREAEIIDVEFQGQSDA